MDSRPRIALVLIFATLALATAAVAQQPKAPAAAPVPAEILSAKSVFISNAGGDTFDTATDQTAFDGDPDRAYNEFYADMKTWGRYGIVSAPASADLDMAISWTLVDTGLKNLPFLGAIRLTLSDVGTHVTLWTIIEPVRNAVLIGNRDKNFDQAMNAVMDRLKAVASQPTPAN